MYDIYPKLLAKSKLPPKENYCFVLMPFAPEFDEVYAEIKRTLARLGFECERADDLSENKPIMTSIVQEILRAHFVIADLTGKNPNVFYELGIAHSFRDMQNVLLLSQDKDFIPFDLRPLPVLFYELGNIRLLTSRLTKTVMENKDYFEAQVKLRERYMRFTNNEFEFDELLSLLGARQQDYWDALLPFLHLNEPRSTEEDSIVSAVFQMKKELTRLSSVGRIRMFRNLYRVFVDLTAYYSYLSPVREFIEQTASINTIAEFSLPKQEMDACMIELAIALFRQERVKQQALDWLFRFIARPKVAGVDLNRARVEAFLMSTNDASIREAIISCLAHNNDLLRESAADFIGEMRIEEALPGMLLLLGREDNPYIIRSIFSAIKKLKMPRGAEAILEWLTENSHVFHDAHLDFVIRHAREALVEIDTSLGTSYGVRLEKLESS